MSCILQICLTQRASNIHTQLPSCQITKMGQQIVNQSLTITAVVAILTSFWKDASKFNLITSSGGLHRSFTIILMGGRRFSWFRQISSSYPRINPKNSCIKNLTPLWISLFLRCQSPQTDKVMIHLCLLICCRNILTKRLLQHNEASSGGTFTCNEAQTRY
ncbi:hypothetical protein V6Z11_A12G002200 [Gossypium hirsutum]